MTLLLLQDLAWIGAMAGSVAAVIIGLRVTQRRPD